MKKNGCYAVTVGRKTGIYLNWYGPKGAQTQVNGCQYSAYKGFSSITVAEKLIKQNKKQLNNHELVKTSDSYMYSNQKNIEIYTDGCSLGNPGSGGYATIIIQNGKLKKLSGGFKYTTNNRMELMACIIGIRELKDRSYVKLYSDSKYVVDGIRKGWAIKWENNKWLKNNKEKAKNSDLWRKLLKLCSSHEIYFNWIKGHDGNNNNEQCDKMASIAANRITLKMDTGYKNSLNES